MVTLVLYNRYCTILTILVVAVQQIVADVVPMYFQCMQISKRLLSCALSHRQHVFLHRDDKDKDEWLTCRQWKLQVSALSISVV